MTKSDHRHDTDPTDTIALDRESNWSNWSCIYWGIYMIETFEVSFGELIILKQGHHPRCLSLFEEK